MIDGVWQINFNGRWYVMSEIGLEPTLDDGEEKVEDGMVWGKYHGCWYEVREARLDYFPFADLIDDEFLDLYYDVYYEKIDGVWHINFNGRRYVMSEIGRGPDWIYY